MKKRVLSGYLHGFHPTSPWATVSMYPPNMLWPDGSAESPATWAANGVRINAVAPGNVHTAMTATMSTTAKMALNALPIPTKYGQECLMAPEEIAEVMVFLASDSARGVNGNIMFVDGGTDALLNSEKVY